MYNHQIAILFTFFILFIVGFCLQIFAKNKETKSLANILTLVSFMLVLVLFSLITIKYNGMSEQIKNKCPEYEKLDNVYKLK